MTRDKSDTLQINLKLTSKTMDRLLALEDQGFSVNKIFEDYLLTRTDIFDCIDKGVLVR